MRDRLGEGTGDLAAALAVTLVALALAVGLTPRGGVHTLFAIPLIFVVPGYAVTAALFPTAGLDTSKRLTLTLGLSLLIAVLGGLILDFTPWGLQTSSWALFLAVVTVSASIIAMRRRRASLMAPQGPSLRLNLRQGMLLGVAVCITAGAVAVARTTPTHPGVSGYTQLWMLPPENSDQTTTRLGITNLELTTTAFRLEVKAADEVVKEWDSIQLKPGETWETRLALPPVRAGGEAPEATLYRLDAPNTAYRRVTLKRITQP